MVPFFHALRKGTRNHLTLNTLRNDPFWLAKRHVSSPKTARFAVRNGTYRRPATRPAFSDLHGHALKGRARRNISAPATAKVWAVFFVLYNIFSIFAVCQAAAAKGVADLPQPKGRAEARARQQTIKLTIMQNTKHFAQMLRDYGEQRHDDEAVVFRKFGSKKWESWTWGELEGAASATAEALLALGVQEQENVGVFSQNCVEYIACDFGAWKARAVTVPFYATSSEQQIQFMLNDAKIRVLFVGEQEQYDKAHRVFALCPLLERIVIFDRSVRISTHDPNALYYCDFLKLAGAPGAAAEVESRTGSANHADVANILYTSGTTGDSKGVVLTHGQYHAALVANGKCVPVTGRDRVMSFLPYAHIFEKGWALLSISMGATLIINTNPLEIQQSMRETHPTSMSAVPRFWEKVYAGVQEQIDRANPVKRALFRNALAVGRRHNIDYVARGLRPPMKLKMEYEMMNRTVFSLVRHELGLERPNIFPTAGATVSKEVEEFVHTIGLNMIVGYGLTESLATVSCDRLGEPFTVGSVGKPIDGLDVKISPEGEILLKGPTITSGYYNRPELTKEAFTPDGYFRTGDAGYLEGGELFLKERIKDLFKTSNGKYIAPQAIEAKLLVDKYIDQIAIIADERKFVSALIIPEYRLVEEFARAHGIPFESREDLCANAKVQRMMMHRIDTLQQQLAHYEQVKRITLLPHHFSMERGELTNTLKLKRSVINENYKAEIDRMYEE